MIKILVMDVDGTLTDGKLYIGNDGEVFKAFDVKDGCGIKDILPNLGVIPVIISARSSGILSRRCAELNIKYLFQGQREKMKALDGVLEELSIADAVEYDYSNVAYIGDDILDLNCMKLIKKAGGIVGCPNDAIEQVKDIADFISTKAGGNGAVREFIHWIETQGISEGN